MKPEDEILQLRKQTNTIIQRLDSLEEKITGEKPVEVQEVSESKLSVGGLITLIIGLFISLNGFFFIIGIPIAIIGLVLVLVKYLNNNSPKTHKEEKITTNKAKNKTSSDNSIKKEVSVSDKKTKNIEETIGAKFLGIIGITALVIGISFFIFMENNGLSYITKIVSGTIFGVAVIFFGDWFSKKKNYFTWGQILTGGGFAITYFSVYSAHFVYSQTTNISKVLDTSLLIIIAIAAIIYSSLKNSKIVAVESFVLGYTAAFLSPVEGVMILIYGLILSVCAIIIQMRKHWNSLSYYFMTGTYSLYLFWQLQNGDFLLGTIFLTTYFLVFNLNIWKGIKKESAIAISNILNGVIYFFLTWLLLEKNSHDIAGWYALGMAIFYGLLYLLIDKKESFSNVYSGIFFLTLFTIIEISKELSTAILVIIMLLFSFLASKYQKKHLTYSMRALGIFILAKIILSDMTLSKGFDPNNFFQNTQLFSLLIAIIGFYLMLKFEKDGFKEFYRYSGSAIIVLTVSSEFNKFNTLVTLLFVITSLVFVLLKGKKSMIQSFIFYGLAGIKAIIYDIWSSKSVGKALNFYDATITSFLPLIFLSYIIRFVSGIKIFSWFGTLLTTMLIVKEFSGFSISILWAVFGLILLLAGFKAKIKELRLQGIILFGITIIKVFTYDSLDLEPVYRTLSFIALGIILIIASFVYAKNKDNIKEMI